MPVSDRMSLESKHGLEILFEDNHLIILNKKISDIVQGDKTGDISLDNKLKAFLKERDNKPGNVFVGIPHRLDRPVSGAVVFAKTGKALSRLTEMFREKQVQKIYYAITGNMPEQPTARLEHFMTRNSKQNKSYCSKTPQPGGKQAVLHYKLLAASDRYILLEVELETGRHHQIRAQLAAIGCPIKGDLKYGAPRSNKNKGISLHARKISFIHPVKKEPVEVVAPFPDGDIFGVFELPQEVRS